MGLDMYLNASRYLEGSWDLCENEEDIKLFNGCLESAGLTKADLRQYGGGGNLELTIAYWRKANAIHNWFVEEVQGGVDDCQPYDVSREKLTELRDECKFVLEHKEDAAARLAPRAGFFFGGTEIEEDYFGDLQLTVDQLTRILDNPKFEKWDFQYLSSR